MKRDYVQYQPSETFKKADKELDESKEDISLLRVIILQRGYVKCNKTTHNARLENSLKTEL